MIWVYDVAVFLFALFSIPKFLIRLNQAADPMRLVSERLGFFPGGFRALFRGQKTVWLHAVSVGEVMAAKNWIRLFLRRYRDWTVALSTTTPTGYSVAEGLASERVIPFYAPVDWSFSVRRALGTVRPKLILLMETELWPNFITACGARNIPIGIVNGRMSPRSYRRYRWVRFWTRSILRKLSFCLVQSQRDKAYFRKLGMTPSRLLCVGNMKFDRLEGRSAAEVKKSFSFGRLLQNHLTLMGASTHWNEEAILLRVLRRLRPFFPGLRLILAPRHPEQMRRVIRAAEREGVRIRFFSELSSGSDFDVLLVDRMGVLASVYPMADLVFVGGSFTRRGGQNPIEAAGVGKPVLHGPHVFNFHDLYQALDRGNGALQVDSEEELFEQASRLFRQLQVRRQMGLQAQQIVESMRGASARTLAYLSSWCSPDGSQTVAIPSAPMGIRSR